MPRTPVGTCPQPESRTALYGAIAIGLRGGPLTQETLGELRLAVGVNAAEKAMARHKVPPRHRRHRKTTRSIANWLMVDEKRLGFDRALVRFPGNGRRQTAILNGLQRVAGVRQVLELEHDRTVLALVLFRGPEEGDDLRASLEELAPEGMLWERVLTESHEAAAGTWAVFAQRAAAEENLSAENVS